MAADHLGNPVTTASARALALLETAVDEFLSFRADPVATLDRALGEDPGFVLAHAWRAALLTLATERRLLAPARVSAQRAAAAAAAAQGPLSERERGHLEAATALSENRWEAARDAWTRVLDGHPRDLFALFGVHLADYFTGDQRALRSRVTALLPQWPPGTPGRNRVLGMAAFGLEEAGEYRGAERLGREAVDADPANVWAIHAVAHVFEMESRVREGIRWYAERAAQWSTGNNFTHHNAWHEALFHLEDGDPSAALARFDAAFAVAQNDLTLPLVDATALLWRLLVAGFDVGDRFEAIARRWESKSPSEHAHYPFNDMHMAMAWAATGRSSAGAALLADLGRSARESGEVAAMVREVGLPVCEAILDYGRGDWEGAVRRLAAVLPVAHRFGGSHAQRDVLEWTQIAAARRSADGARAQEFVNERHARRPPTRLSAGWGGGFPSARG